MKKVLEMFSSPNVEGFLKPFKRYHSKSHVSPNNKIVNAYFYGEPHPGFPEHNIVSINNRFINSYLFGDEHNITISSSNVSPNNKIVRSKLKLTKGF
jgi:hypothetical protein